MSAGGSHTCGLTSSGRVYCWGSNDWGQLGDGTNDRRLVPTAVSGGLVFVQVSAGAYHTCAVTAQNRAYCWGNNSGETGAPGGSYEGGGKLGDGTFTDRSTPTAVGGGRRFVLVRAGTLHTCAVNPNNVAFCWGGRSFGKLGTDPTTDQTLPARVLGGHDWRRVAALPVGSPRTTRPIAGATISTASWGLYPRPTARSRSPSPAASALARWSPAAVRSPTPRARRWRRDTPVG